MALKAAWVFTIGRLQRFPCSDIILKKRQKKDWHDFLQPAKGGRWTTQAEGTEAINVSAFRMCYLRSLQLCPIGTFKHSEKLSHKPNTYLNPTKVRERNPALRLSSYLAPAHGWVWKTLTGMSVWETSRLSRGFFYFLRHSAWIHHALSQNKEN